MAPDSPAGGGAPLTRRTLLKALGIAAGASAVPGSLQHLAEARVEGKPPGPPPARAFIYIDHAVREHWVGAALLVGDPRHPRQLLRRAKRGRVHWRKRQETPEIEARDASDALKRRFYELLAQEKGFRKGRGQGMEVYGIHIHTAGFAGRKDVVGAVQQQIVLLLLNACRLSRFREVFVYHNLPAFKHISRKRFRQAVLRGTQRHPAARFEVYAQRGSYHASGMTLVNDGIQAADLVAHAFYQKHQYGNAEWLNMIRRLVRRDIDAIHDPGVRAILQG